MMKYYTYTDRHGYVSQIDDDYGGDMDEMLRAMENFAAEANLDYAHGSVSMWDEDPTEVIEIWNCETAMSHGMRCQCEQHE